MGPLETQYKRLLDSGEGDIVIKFKNGERIRVVSFIIKSCSSVFRAMIERNNVREGHKNVLVLSSLYKPESFKEFLAYIYYNKPPNSVYIPFLFELLAIANFFDVPKYREIITSRIIGFITDKPIALIIAAEALEMGSAADTIHAECITCLGEDPKTVELPAFIVLEPTSTKRSNLPPMTLAERAYPQLNKQVSSINI